MLLATSSLLNFSTYAASSFRAAMAVDPIYLYVGGSSPWASEDAPPTELDTVASYHKIWDNMAGLIKVSPSDIAAGIDRNDWITGLVYTHYDDSIIMPELHTGNGSVILAGSVDRDVYICLDNNGDSLSTSKPTHRNFTKKSIRESDGYIWKYLYSISDYDFVKFATKDIIPVRSSGKVTGEATGGAIYNVLLNSTIATGTGSKYRGTGFSNGTNWVSAANVTFNADESGKDALITLEDSGNGFSTTPDNYFSNSILYITSGLSSGSMRRIINSDLGSGTNPSTVSIDLSANLASVAIGDSAIIGPEVTIENDTRGQLFSGLGIVNGEGKITEVLSTFNGIGYANGNMVVNINGGYNTAGDSNLIGSGFGASVDAFLPPSMGHGSRPQYHLGAKYTIISVSGTLGRQYVNEQGIFCGIDNEIRQIGLLHAPLSGKVVAHGTSYDLRTHLYFEYDSNSIAEKLFIDNLSGLNKDVMIRNRTTNATGILWGTHLSKFSESTSRRWISLTNTQGNFYDGDDVHVDKGDGVFTYDDKISSIDLSSYEYPEGLRNPPLSSVVLPEVTKYTGDIIYHENVSPIARRDSQKETFKIIFEF
jgi:hypothetical protein